MLLAAIARPEKTAALVGISTAADLIVTLFNSLPLEVGTYYRTSYTSHGCHFVLKTADIFISIC